MCDLIVYSAPQNIPSATVLTLGKKVVLYMEILLTGSKGALPPHCIVFINMYNSSQQYIGL